MECDNLSRPTWDEYFIDLSRVVAARSTCQRKQIGAVLAKDQRVISVGYNGSPSGMKHCTEAGCRIVDGHCTRCIHAEMNAIIQCAIHGISPVGSTLYCTYTPCFECAKCLIQARITRIVYEKIYSEDVFRYLTEETKIQVEKTAQ